MGYGMLVVGLMNIQFCSEVIQRLNFDIVGICESWWISKYYQFPNINGLVTIGLIYQEKLSVDQVGLVH